MSAARFSLYARRSRMNPWAALFFSFACMLCLAPGVLEAQVANTKTIAIGIDLYQGVLLASDGSLYTKNQGAAVEGCADNQNNNCSTIYKIAGDGTTTIFHNFQETSTLNNADGLQPTSLIEGTDGNFYGTCAGGGSLGYGTLFKIAPDGTFTLLYDFPGTPATPTTNPTPTVGGTPVGLVEGADGNFYGIASAGISATLPGDTGPGLFFQITPDGDFTPLHIFSLYSVVQSTGISDGYYPTSIMQGQDGNFYVTMTDGQNGSPGGIDRVTPDGNVTVIYNFASDGSEGNAPMGPLAQGSDSSFYGVSASGVKNPDYTGYAFRLTPSGSLNILHHFTAGADGGLATGDLLLASDGNLYGTTVVGGDAKSGNCPAFMGCGTAYQLTTSGTLTTLHNFEGGIATSTIVANNPNVDGAGPQGPIVQGGGGTFYGVTEGAPGGNATAYSLSLATPIPAPIQLTFNPASTVTGSPTVLTWKVLNAFSKTAQVCGGSLLPNPDQGDSDGAWNGVMQTGKLVDGVYTGTATITPIAAGVYNFALTCGGLQTGFATLTVTGNSPLKIQTTSVPKGSVSQPYQVIFGAMGGVYPYIWTEVGPLPPGLTFDPGTGILSGKPLQFGTYSFAVGVQDSSNPPLTDGVSIQMIVASSLVLSSILPQQRADTAYLAQLDTSGGVSPYDYQLLSGTLPPGLRFNAVNGVISGTATETGSYTFVIQASDNENPKATVQTTFVFPTIAALQVLTPNILPDATINVPYTQTLSAQGGVPPYTWAFGTNSNLNYKPPPGLTLSSDGVLSGTPLQSVPANNHQYFTVVVSDSGNPKAMVPFDMGLYVKSTLQITTTSLPNGQVGTTTTVPLTATGGVPPYTWKASSAPNPEEVGLYFNSTYDEIIYTPIAALTANVTLYLSDSEPNPATETLALPLVILPAPSATTTMLTTTNAAAGTGEDVTLTATVAVPGVTADMPGGPVIFYNGTASIGNAMLNAQGIATLQTSFAAPGVYSITAAYGGNTYYGPSTSAALTETVVTPTVSISISPSSLTLASGASGTLVLTITPVGDYSNTVTFSCGNLPVHVSCSFVPPTLQIASGSGPVTDTLTVNTAAPLQSALNRPWSTNRTLAAAILWAPGSLVLLCGSLRRRRWGSLMRQLSVLVLLATGLATATLLSGCGSASQDAKAGTYTIPINLTLSGGTSKSVSAMITVQ